MAVESERSRPPLDLRENARVWGGQAGRAVGTGLDLLRPVGRWMASTAPARFISANLLRRIFLTNFLGLFILLIGILYFTQHNVWLIQVDAKRESLAAQGEILAAAIAANATIEYGNRIAIDPEKLPGADDFERR